jgi:CoA:oxalate CoA-transferase
VSGPLAGLRILEIGHMLAGPYCGLLLADLGADVIKIEPPTGDIGREASPHFVGPHNAYFASLNRNKRGVVIDLATLQGQHELHELAQSADALITNLRPSAIRKLGLTYADLRGVNPKLVCVALTGYGMTSPYAERPAYDYVIQALTGVMELTGDPGAMPTKTGYSAVDNSAGVFAALSLVAKIHEGKGGQIDIAMYDVMISQLNYIASSILNGQEVAERRPNSAHPYFVPAQIFATSDSWLVLFITHDRFWAHFCKEVGKPEWITSATHATIAARNLNRDLVTADVAKVLAQATTDEWLARLLPLGLVAAGITTLDYALETEQTKARKMVIELPSSGGVLRLVGNPIKIDGHVDHYFEPPELGEHNDLLLGPVKHDAA